MPTAAKKPKTRRRTTKPPAPVGYGFSRRWPEMMEAQPGMVRPMPGAAQIRDPLDIINRRAGFTLPPPGTTYEPRYTSPEAMQDAAARLGEAAITRMQTRAAQAEGRERLRQLMSQTPSPPRIYTAQTGASRVGPMVPDYEELRAAGASPDLAEVAASNLLARAVAGDIASLNQQRRRGIARGYPRPSELGAGTVVGPLVSGARPRTTTEALAEYHAQKPEAAERYAGRADTGLAPAGRADLLRRGIEPEAVEAARRVLGGVGQGPGQGQPMTPLEAEFVFGPSAADRLQEMEELAARQSYHKRLLELQAADRLQEMEELAARQSYHERLLELENEKVQQQLRKIESDERVASAQTERDKAAAIAEGKAAEARTREAEANIAALQWEREQSQEHARLLRNPHYIALQHLGGKIDAYVAAGQPVPASLEEQEFRALTELQRSLKGESQGVGTQPPAPTGTAGGPGPQSVQDMLNRHYEKVWVDLTTRQAINEAWMDKDHGRLAWLLKQIGMADPEAEEILQRMTGRESASYEHPGGTRQEREAEWLKGMGRSLRNWSRTATPHPIGIAF